MRLYLLISVVLAAAAATELGLEGLKPAELKEIEKEIAAGNVPPNYVAEKPKRGVAKLTNTDSPNFNLINSTPAKYNEVSTYNTQAYSSLATPSYNQAATPAASPTYPQTPYRFVYPNQYYPSNQYLTQIQNPYIASQVASQYAYQPQLPHFVQTPTQIQYVSPPNYSQVPSAQFKALTSKAPTTTATADAKTAAPEQATSQVILPSNMVANPIYQQYQQPQFYMYLVPQQQVMQHQQQQQYIYPGQQQMLLISPQSPLLGYLNQHRFGVSPFTSPAATQLAYLTAGQQQQQVTPYQTVQTAADQYQTLQQTQQQYQQAGQDANNLKPINVQQVSSNAFGTRTKA